MEADAEARYPAAMPAFLTPRERGGLERVAQVGGTPCYAYLLGPIRERIRGLAGDLGGTLAISYAVKANPNIGLLREIRKLPATLDVSSVAELERGLAAGFAASEMTFSGPAKREFELRRAVAAGCGEIVCESEAELRALSRIAVALGRKAAVLLRINPSRMPSQFGVNMAGKPSAFGIDEEVAEPVVALAADLPGLDLAGFHIYSGTNSLNANAIDENFGIFIEIFHRLAERARIVPRTLVFGSGFGIPYTEGQLPLDTDTLLPKIRARIAAMREIPCLSAARCKLEMGRWLVGPCGYLLSAVIGVKHSRGTDIALLDAGFNNHLAAAGMMGTVIRRNWPFEVLTGPVRPTSSYTLVGPLCTTIDQLATKIELPTLSPGDILAVSSSGAYGLTASPTRFISHPEPCEFLIEDDGSWTDVTESRASWPAATDNPNG